MTLATKPNHHTPHRTHHVLPLQYRSLPQVPLLGPPPMTLALHVIAGLCLAIAYTLALHAFLNPTDTQDTP